MNERIWPSEVNVDEELPMAVPVYVQCDGFRSLAYQDESGVWRHFYTRQPVNGPVRRVPYEEIN